MKAGSNNTINPTDDEYIRKADLLQWLESIRQQTTELRSWYGYNFFYQGQIAMLDEVVRHINHKQ